MALRLNDVVVAGELLNTSNYSTDGYLALRGCDQPLLLQLAGNPAPDLQGWHIRAEARDADEEDPDREEIDLTDLVWQQARIGRTS